MTDESMTSLDYEAEAIRLRARMHDTIGELRANLEPARLIDEIADTAGANATPTGATIATAIRRHPIAATAAAFGVGLLAYSSFVRRKTNRAEIHAGSWAPGLSSSLAQSAASVLQERGAARRRQFVDGARARIAGGAAGVADRIDEAIDDLTDGLPGGEAVRPLLQSGVQLALSAALEAIVARIGR